MNSFQEDSLLNKIHTSPTVDEVIKRIEQRETGFRKLLNALKKVGFIFALGFFVGLTFIIIHHFFMEPYDDPQGIEQLKKVHPIVTTIITYGFILKDVGLGLIVASIAVVLYEWGSHMKGAIDLSEVLIAAIGSTEKATKKLEDGSIIQGLIKEQHEVLTSSTGSFVALNAKLDELFKTFDGLLEQDSLKSGSAALEKLISSTEVELGFANKVKQLVGQVLKFKKASDDPSTQSYVDSQKCIYFLNWLLETCVLSYAHSLLPTVRHDYMGHGHFTAIIPTSREVSSMLLGSFMGTMVEGDEYLAVTHPTFWVGMEWDYFQGETKEACTKRNVKICRLFVISDHPADKQFYIDRFEMLKGMIIKHQDLEKESDGNYEIRFFGQNEAKNAVAVGKRYGLSLNENDYISTKMAIFKRIRQNSQDSIRVLPIDDDFSRLDLARDDIYVYETRFKTMWEVAIKDSPFSGNGLNYQFTSPKTD